jgi:hypothetical protein
VLVTLTGAYRNAGDHLIGARARALLSEFVETDIVNVDRRSIGDAEYELFNNARAVILCGGPAYQKEMFPKVYNLDLSRISTRVIPLGLGWKGSLNDTPETFKFAPAALEFIGEVHSRIQLSSVRDVVTEQVVRNTGASNVSMTGCPAWYDLAHLNGDYTHKTSPKLIVFSMPAKPQPNVLETLAFISKKYPHAQKVLALHHGWKPAQTKHGERMLRWHAQVAALAGLRGWKTMSIADGLTKFEELYSAADLHIGYRVHAHLYSLSQQSASILVNEDSRGVGQVSTLGGPMLMATSGPAEILAAIEEHYASGGAAVANSAAVIKQTFPKMREFLATI